MSSIRINDVFEELSEENKRLLNELMFANKCLNVLIRFKTFIDFNCNKLKTNLNSNDSQKFDELIKEIEELLKEKKNSVKPPNKTTIEGMTESLSLKSKKKTVISNIKQKRNAFANNKTNPKILKPSKQKVEIQKKGIKNVFLIPKKETSDPFLIDIENDLFSNKKPKIIEKPIEKFDVRTNVNTIRLRYICDFIGCGKDFRTKTNLRKHLKTHGLQLYERNICGHEGCSFRSHYVKELNEHMKAHDGVKPHECQTCGKRFNSRNCLRSHLRHSHELSDQILVCEFCNKHFKTEMSFKRHQNISHFAQKRFECQECDYKNKSRYGLEMHVLAIHTTEKRFKCSFEGCSKTFKTPILHKHHENTHNPNRFVRCTHEGCDRIIMTSRLRKHLRDQHSGIKYSCDWPGCDFVTNRTENLQLHSCVHSSEYNFLCDWPQCGKRFRAKRYLDRHLRIHTNDKRYACSWPDCQYRCTDSGNLIKHKRVHQKK